MMVGQGELGENMQGDIAVLEALMKPAMRLLVYTHICRLNPMRRCAMALASSQA